MFNWFRPHKPPVVFADNGTAFAHACSLGYEPLLGALIPAVVEEEGEINEQGEHTFLIRLANAEGGSRIWCSTFEENRSFPSAGDLVGFRVVTVASDIPVGASLIGYIACKLKPIFVPRKGWVVEQSYTPPNLKPALHL